jgi:MYND finger
MATIKTLDLHNLAAILLHEWSLMEPRFLHSRLQEITAGTRPQNALRSDIHLPHLGDVASSGSSQSKKAYFVMDELPGTPPVTAFSFKHADFASAKSYSEQDIETMFWQIKNHNRGYALTHAMQTVLDSLPNTVHLMLRTSQGHSLLVEPKQFAIEEFKVLPNEKVYICQATPQPVLGPTKFALHEYTTGATGPIPWVYLAFAEAELRPEFRNTDPRVNGRIVLDLAAPLLAGMRGLGNETFALERMGDYHDRVIPKGGSERERPVTSGRIDARLADVGLMSELSKRVLGRVQAILESGETSCGYCGKASPKSSCGRCKQARFCDKRCQTLGWKYHKKWCSPEAGVMPQ